MVLCYFLSGRGLAGKASEADDVAGVSDVSFHLARLLSSRAGKRGLIEEKGKRESREKS